MNDWIKKHIHAVIGVILYIITVIVLLFLLGFRTPLPLPPEEAILIDFAGGGNRDAGASLSATSSDKNTSSQSSSISGVNTQNFEDAASMQSSNIPNTNPVQNTPANNVNTNNSTTNTTQTNPNAEKLNNLFGGNVFGNGSGTGNSGSGSGSGNPGTGLDGTGSGSGPGGVGGSLTGRRKVRTVEPVGQDNLTGRVVLRITVNENGDVTDVTLVSTNCDKCVKPAIDAVKQWKYESKPGSGYQTGNVTVEFKQN